MKNWTVGSALVFSSIVIAAASPVAEAKSSHTTSHGHAVHHARVARPAGSSSHHLAHSAYYRHGRSRYVHLAGISCVPFARAESGIVLTGNAATWWDEAEGRYARGTMPEPGSVLNFRANAAMHLGHVAVVKNVVNAREIEIDQANWWGPGGGRGRVSRDVAVIDVSLHNDWSAVRVSLGRGGAFGSVYPTYGFIYDRPDGAPAPVRLQYAAASGIADLNTPPRDLRPRRERGRLADLRHSQAVPDVEVAEAPATGAGPIVLDAPNRDLR